MNKLKRVKLIFTPFLNCGKNAAGVELVTPATGKFDKANFVAVFCKEEGNAEFKYICEFDNGGQFPNQAMDRARDYIQPINQMLLELYELAEALENSINASIKTIALLEKKPIQIFSLPPMIKDHNNLVYRYSVLLEAIDGKAREISGWTPAAPVPIDNKEDL